jgi:hypothetical protein
MITETSNPVRVQTRPFSEWTKEHGDVLWYHEDFENLPHYGSPYKRSRMVMTPELLNALDLISQGWAAGDWAFCDEDEPALRWAAIPVPLGSDEPPC